MRNDLTRRLGDDAQRATDLLRPLAYAEGQGLPWEDIWAPLASAISGRHYTNEDLMWLWRTAGAYVVEATEADRSAYRLYHQSLVEYLRDDTVAPSIHAAFLDVFTRAVPYGADGRRDWSRAHPYTLRYLATHASDANRLDVLLQDTGYLVHAAPRSLTPLLHNARSEAARETSTIYRSCLPLLLESTPEQRRQVMATSAAAFKATDLMDHLNSEANRSGWTVRWAAGKGASPAIRDTLIGHAGPIQAVACTTLDNRPIAVTGSSDSTARLWDLTTGTQIGEPLTGHTRSISAVACTTLDNRPIAVTASSDSTVRLWDLTTGTQIGEPLTSHTYWISAVACTTLDNRRIAVTGSLDNSARLWDLTTGTQIGEPLTGHTNSIHAVACTTLNGRPIAVTASSDNTARLWDLTTGTQIGEPLTGHTNSINAVACTTLDNRPIAVTGSD
ncbi:WD40 repeat domain-containing protein, partial [Streptomyces althioticus]|uniref:WD40 repeat domain-containing protein n=1 Tax=Streptomyces althioticus TaxID=83380 RepID=UPI003425C70D